MCVCVYECACELKEAREKKRVSIRSMDLLSRSKLRLPDPLGTEATAGNLTPMMSSSESTGYRQSVRKCTKPKVNITQLLGLIVFTVEQLWWIKGFTDKVLYMC